MKQSTWLAFNLTACPGGGTPGQAQPVVPPRPPGSHDFPPMNTTPPVPSFPWRTWVSAFSLAALGLPGAPSLRAAEEQVFPSPTAAVSALITAANRHDTNALRMIFGPGVRDLLSPDPVQADGEFNLFVTRLAEGTRFSTNSPSNLTLELGLEAWPFPLPVVEAAGVWHFDTAAGKTEILNRRIGMAELGAKAVCQAYVEAQREYAIQLPFGDGVLAYARYLGSTPGTRNGLFWPAKDNEPLSPLGPLVAAARVEGYPCLAQKLNDELGPYRGYYFKILTQQGKNAPGGKFDYLDHQRLIAGFALVAWPAEWGNTGVMTFIVNQGGEIHQKNLGARTVNLARAMTTYDPDPTWILSTDR